jgi:hypothetical protein
MTSDEAKKLLRVARDLKRCDLRGASLTMADLSTCDFTDANLSQMDLTGCNLSQAVLRFCSFYDSDLTHVDFTEADLFCADLDYATMRGACFKGAELGRATFPSRPKLVTEIELSIACGTRVGESWQD